MVHLHHKKTNALDLILGKKNKRDFLGEALMIGSALLPGILDATGVTGNDTEDFGDQLAKYEEYFKPRYSQAPAPQFYTPTAEAKWTQQPEYPEAESARKLWSEKLMGWGNDPNYGGISPEWDAIWKLASQKVNDYYLGAPGQTGMMDILKSSAAQRNVSQSPALEETLANMGMGMGRQISDLALNEAVNKATFGESARQNWATQMSGLASMKPAGYWQGAYTQPATVYNYSGAFQSPTQGGDLAGGLGTAVASVGSNMMQQDWLSKLSQNLGGVGGSGGGAGSLNSMYGTAMPTSSSTNIW